MSSDVGYSDIQFDLPAMLDIGIKSIAAVSEFELQPHQELSRLLSYIRRHVIQFMQIPNQHLCGMLLDLETCVEQCLTSYQADVDRRERVRSTLRSALQLIFNRAHGFVEFEIQRRKQSPSEALLPEFESVRSSVPFPSSRRLPALPVTDADFGVQAQHCSFPRYMSFSAKQSNIDRSAEIEFLCHQVASRLEAIEHNAPAVLIIYGQSATSMSKLASDLCDRWRKRLPKSEIVCHLDRCYHDNQSKSNRFWHQNAMKQFIPPQLCAPDVSISESIQMIPLAVNIRRATRITPMPATGSFQFSVTKSDSDSLECKPIKVSSSHQKVTHFPYSDLRRQYLSQFYGKTGVVCVDHVASVEDALVLVPPLPGYLSIICCSNEDLAHSIAQHVYKQEVFTELPQCLLARRCIQTPICLIHELKSSQLEISPLSISESWIETVFFNATTGQQSFTCCFQYVFRQSCGWDAVKLCISQCYSNDEFAFLESLLSTGLLQCSNLSDSNVQFSISDSVRVCARNFVSTLDAAASSELQTRISAVQRMLLEHFVADVWLPLTQQCYINALPRLALLQYDRYRFELECSLQISMKCCQQFSSTVSLNSLDSVDQSPDRTICSSELRAFEKQFSTTFIPSWLLMLRPHTIFRLRFSKQHCFELYSACLSVVSLPWTPALLQSFSSKSSLDLNLVSDKFSSFAVLMLQYQAEVTMALGDLISAASPSELRSFEVDEASVRSARECYSDAQSIAVKLRHICPDDADFSAILAAITSRLGLMASQASPVNLDTTVEHFQQALQLDQLSVAQYCASEKIDASAWCVDHLNEICSGMLNTSLLPHTVHDRLSAITESRMRLAASLKRAGAFQNALQHLEAAVSSTEREFELYLQLLALVEHDVRFVKNEPSVSNSVPISVDDTVAFSALQSYLCHKSESIGFVSAIHSTRVALLSSMSQLATLHLQIAHIYELAGATSLAAVSASKSLDMIEMVDKHSAEFRWPSLSPSLAASASRALVSEALQSDEQQRLWDAFAFMDASRLRLQTAGACAAYSDCCQVCALLLSRIGQFDRTRTLFSEACVVYEYLRDHRRLIASLIQLGNTHTTCRNLDGALTSLYDAVALARAWEAHCADIKPRVSMQRSRSLCNGSFWEPLSSDFAWEIIGENLSSFSDSDSESEEWHARAAEIRAESLASALQAIGNTLLASSEHEAALDSLRESVGLWQRLANGRRDRTDRQRDKVSRRRRRSRLSDAASLDLSDLNESFGRTIFRSKSVDDTEVAAVNISMCSAPPTALLSPFEPDRSAAHRSALTASLLSMAVCQIRLGQFTKAVVALSKCRRARVDCDDWLGVAEVSDHFGYLYHSIGDFSTAIEHLQESRRIYIRLNAFHASFLASGSLLHGTLFAIRDIDKTIDLLGVLLDRHDRAGNAFATAVVNRALGRALLSGGDTTAALTHLQLATTQFEALRSLSEFVAPAELEHEIRAVQAAITEAEHQIAHQKK